MLLSLMRKHAKSWLIKFLIGIIAVVFIFYFGYSFTSDRGVKIAYVNGEVISGLEYDKAYTDLVEAVRVQYGGLWDEKMIKGLDLRKKALAGLINQKLISYEAKRLGLKVTDEDVQKAIRSYSAFQVNGQFDMGRYRALLGHHRMNPEDFEESMSQELLQKKLQQFLFAFMEATDQEVLDSYTFANEKTKVSFVQFRPEKFNGSVKTDKAAIENYFNSQKEKYRVPEKIKVAYIEIDPKTFKEKVRITDKELRSYYEYNIETFRKPKQIKARHILFKLDPGASEADEKKVREKAERVLKDAREGKDFAELARTHSEGPTRSKGGDLGAFSAGQMVRPFEEAAFKLNKGEISDLVRTDFGIHIIKVYDIKDSSTRSLEEARDQILETLTDNLSSELAHEKGLSLMDQMPYDVDLTKYAQDQGLKVKFSGYFSKDDEIPGIGGNEMLRKNLFSLEEKETTDLMELNGKFCVFQVVERKASYLPEINEVRDAVKRDLISYLSGKEARAAAEKFLAELRKGKGWKELAKAYDLKIEETGFFTRLEQLSEIIGYAPDLNEVAFSLNKEKRYPDRIFQNDKGIFIIRWESSKGISEKDYQKEKGKYRLSLMQTKHRRAFQKWVENLRKDADIEIVTPVT